MNREECKITIAQQFRNLNAPIRALMLAPDVNTLNKARRDTFKTRDEYFVKEFDLGFTIEHIPDQPENPTFQLCFYDLSDDRILCPEEEIKNLSGSEFKTIGYHVERIVFRGTKIEFWRVSFNMDVASYYFSNENVEMEKIASFDVKTQKFDEADPLVPFKNILDASFLFSPTYHYVEYLFSDKSLHELEAFLIANQIDGKTHKRYLETFRAATIGATYTTSMIIFKNLVVLQEGKWVD